MTSFLTRLSSMGGSSRYVAIFALIGVPTAAGLFFRGSGGGVWVIILVTFITLLILMGIFFFFLHLWKKKKGKELSKALRKDADSVEVSGIDSMRSNFETGVEKLNKAGKNVYDLPWFLLAGQAGSGKTEAIRRSHSKEDFPPGLNDLMQGVGGTLNMNWWFTNQGIVLDTAGRVFEEKVEAGKSNEWQEFLKMLKKVRKNMPINGFILVIPADSLIRDDFSVIEEKASHIAEQITLVQNILGIRFPVFILVTKTDFIPGFREFVENIGEPKLQQQMLGWSNPNSLDEPFVPEQVDEYIEDVISKLKKRRLTYMLDPRAEDGKKRLDDLDALFTFPNELRAAVPNLRRYIEIVFSLNPWSQKPLFIRGIYFTSSLQQGDALDKALAEVMGKNLGDMALSSFKKETPLFLRDSFFEKMYRETGLVTSSSEVKSAMRRRTLIFSGASLAVVLLVLTAAVLGSRSFRKSIGNEYVHWKFAEGEYHESVEPDREYDWGRPIVYDTGIDDVFETEKEVTFEVAGNTYTLPTYLEQMGLFAQSSLDIPKVFRPLKFFDDVFTGNSVDRKTAFRHLYEDAIILPLLINGREKLRSVDEDSWGEKSAAGLHSMIQIQILLNQTERESGYAEKFWKELDKLYFFLTEDHLGTKLEEIYFEFFTDAYVDASGWPNETFSLSYSAINTLEDERLEAVTHGLSLWVNEIGDIRVKQEEKMKQLVEVLNTLEKIGGVETEFLAKTYGSSLVNIKSVDELEKEYAQFTQSTEELSVDGEPFTFTAYYLKQINQAKESVDKRVNNLNAGVDTSDNGDERLIKAILERVDEQRKELVQSFDRIVDPDLLERFKSVDQNYLDSENGVKARIDFYRELATYLQHLREVELDEWSMAAATLSDLREQQKLVMVPTEKFSEEQQSNVETFEKLAEEELGKTAIRLFEGYQKLLLEELKSLIGFPVFADAQRAMSVEEISGLKSNLENVVENINEFKAEMDPVQSEEFEQMLESVDQVTQFVETYFTPDFVKEVATIQLPSLMDISLGSLSDTIVWRARLVQLEGSKKAMRIGQQAELIGEVELNEDKMTVLFTSTIDGQTGDVGSVTISGGWVPLQLLLRDEDKVKSVGKSKYIYRGRVNVPSYRSVAYGLILDFSKSVPDKDDWLRTSTLKGF